jgi:outer membrane protein OmpA-like peptidoglycan-associated protein
MKKTILLILLIVAVLSVFQCGDKEQPQPQPQPQPQTNVPPRENTDFDAIRKQINSDLLFRIEVFNFPPDKWDIQSEMGPTFDKLAEMLKKLIDLAKKINSADKIKITVIGFSDSSGTNNRKMLVSENRARQVIDYLVQKKSFDKNYFTAQWRGDQELKDPQEPLSGKNRRVIVFFEGIKN